MNRYFVSLIIALGSLGFVTSSASAAGTSQEIPVTFKGIAATVCNVGSIAAATPGVLTASADGTTLTTTLAGGIANITCNTDHSVSVGAPQQTTPTLLAGEFAGETLTNPTYTAQVTDLLGNVASAGAASPLPLPIGGLAGVNALTVEMTAKNGDSSVLKAGVYEFEVPVTITCN